MCPDCTDGGCYLCEEYKMLHAAWELSEEKRKERLAMGDRFYQQQLAATGDCPGASDAQKKRKTNSTPRLLKSDVVAALPIGVQPQLKKLLLAELQEVAVAWPTRKLVETPTSRLRKPYVDALNESCNLELTWKGLTIVDMEHLLSVAVS